MPLTFIKVKFFFFFFYAKVRRITPGPQRDRVRDRQSWQKWKSRLLV